MLLLCPFIGVLPGKPFCALIVVHYFNRMIVAGFEGEGLELRLGLVGFMRLPEQVLRGESERTGDRTDRGDQSRERED